MNNESLLNLPNNIEIECFLQVAKTLNFTQAATNLFISQQAVSKHISTLEAELGFPLFKRSTRRVELTTEGEKVNLFFIHTLREYETLIKAGRNSSLSEVVHFDLGIMSSTSPSILAKSIREFSSKESRLDFIWHYGEPSRIINMVEERQIDMGFVYEEAVQGKKNLLLEKLIRITPKILVANHLVNGKKHNEVLDVVRDIPFGAHLRYKFDEDNSKKEAEAFLINAKIQCSGIKIYDSMEASLVGVELGECFTIANELLPIYFSPFFKHIPIDWSAALVCVWHKNNKNIWLSPVIQHLKETIQS